MAAGAGVLNAKDSLACVGVHLQLVSGSGHTDTYPPCTGDHHPLGQTPNPAWPCRKGQPARCTSHGRYPINVTCNLGSSRVCAAIVSKKTNKTAWGIGRNHMWSFK